MQGRWAVDAAAAALHAESVVIDLHVDTLLWTRIVGYDPLRRHRTWRRGRRFGGQVDLPRMLEGGVSGVGLGLVPNPALRGRRASGLVDRYLDDFDRWVEGSGGRLRRALAAADVERAHDDGAVAAFLGLEGAHGLGGDLDRVAVWRDRGLRYVGLAHFTANQACKPAFGVGATEDDGLTGWGRDLVRECERLDVIVDLAHLNRRGFFEACELATKPVYVTHTGVRGVLDHWRNVDDEALRAVADLGGVLGVIFYPKFLTGSWRSDIDDVCRHVEHIAATVGWDHVAIGTDFDGMVPVLPEGVRDIADLPRVTAALLRRGNRPDDVRKALGANALRVLRDVGG